MWIFKRVDILPYLFGHKYITFVGAGGKTSFIEYIAARSFQRGKRVAITTTTKIFAKEPYILFNDKIDSNLLKPFIRIGRTIEEGKLTSVDLKDIESLAPFYDIILIEADGAKGKPLKFPSHYEPIIPPFSDLIFVLGGLDALNGRVEDRVFRWELFKGSKGVDPKQTITEEIFMRFFEPDCLLKGVDKYKATIVLNKYDSLMLASEGIKMAKHVGEKTGIGEVMVASVKFGLFYSVVPAP
ncbi:MAG: selenium cofactor biosynthesis protein YqeC [Syntrophorhabdaceae bacterium]|nr:selenium cofactor biosynthesis protein YqeC [Syntrophorhabdaceae bacterium]